jgi:hypothetical protein
MNQEMSSYMCWFTWERRERVWARGSMAHAEVVGKEQGDWDSVTCPWHVTYEQFCALPPSSDRRIKNQRPDAMNSTRLQCSPQCTATVHRLKSVDCTYATGLSTVHCYSILILAVHFRPNGPDRKAPNCSSVTCPWHVTGSQSGAGREAAGAYGRGSTMPCPWQYTTPSPRLGEAAAGDPTVPRRPPPDGFPRVCREQVLSSMMMPRRPTMTSGGGG